MLGHETGSVYKMSPEMEGIMLFFPSELNHAVYPFYNCDEERISISGNLMLDTRVCVWFLTNQNHRWNVLTTHNLYAIVYVEREFS